jgi:hypothetical protein
VLNILREHEKRLDDIIGGLDYTIQALSETQHRLEALCERIEDRELD